MGYANDTAKMETYLMNEHDDEEDLIESLILDEAVVAVILLSFVGLGAVILVGLVLAQ